MQMSIVMLWQPSDALHDAFVDWLKNEFMPGVLDSPDALQSSIYKLQHASVAQTTGVDIQDISKMASLDITCGPALMEKLRWGRASSVGD
jgi:hypothetical protein